MLELENLTDCVFRDGLLCYALGDFSDVHKSTLEVRGSYHQVAVKVVRGYHHSQKAVQRLWNAFRSILIEYNQLKHPNIMPILGFSENFGMFPGIVLPFSEQGSITNFARRGSLALKLNLLSQVASGVAHMHSQNFIHSDIRGANIMICDGVPQIMDGGVNGIISCQDFTTNGSGSCRWTAPEVLYPDDHDEDISTVQYTPASDVYSLGMTILEVVTGARPFNDIRHDPVVIMRVLSGEKPRHFSEEIYSEDLWRLLSACWDLKFCRPTANLIAAWLADLSVQ